MFIVLSGVDHSELVSLADKHFGNVSLTHEYEIPGFKRCRFTGSEVITHINSSNHIIMMMMIWQYIKYDKYVISHYKGIQEMLFYFILLIMVVNT